MNSTYDEQTKKEGERYEPGDPEGIGPEDNVYSVDGYDLVTTSSDFNVNTIIDFIESSVFLPGFQRNYVWPIKRASRLIESAIVGLPIPQIFLYEESKNKFLLIDGQQRLMSIYYFRKGRFPKKEALQDLRTKFLDQDKIKEMPIFNDDCFVDFQLDLPDPAGKNKNKLHRLKYDDLDDEMKSTFNLRSIRSVVVRQIQPKGYGSIYEIFSRLNTGGLNLNQQEIRRSMFRSRFLEMLYDINTSPNWRRLVGSPTPDSRAKDVEVLLRGCAMLVNGKKYTAPLVQFLNAFTYEAQKYDQIFLNRLQQTLNSFLEENKILPTDAFYSTANRFSPPIFESVFAAACAQSFKKGDKVKVIQLELLDELKNDPTFIDATQYRTSGTANVKLRLERARAILADQDV